jgi:cytochrome c oxidase subunit 4
MSQNLAAHPYARDLSKLSPEDRALIAGKGERQPAAAPMNHHEADGEVLAHPVPLWLLLSTFAGLMVLTFFTVAATWFDFGALNIWIAVGIAAVKAVLVAVVFMHLKWDNPFNAFALVATFFFLALFIGVVCMDTQQTDPLKQTDALGNLAIQDTVQ